MQLKKALIEKEKELTFYKQTFSGRLLSFITFQSFPLSMITAIFCSLFSSVKKEVQKRKNLISALDQQKDKAQQSIIELKKIIDQLNTIQKLTNELQVKFSHERARIIWYHKIKALFSNFTDQGSFSSLEIKHQHPLTFLSSSSFTASDSCITKGKNADGQRFFIIRFKDREQDRFGYQLICETMNAEQLYWSSYGKDASLQLPSGVNLMIAKKGDPVICFNESFEELQEILKNGASNYEDEVGNKHTYLVC